MKKALAALAIGVTAVAVRRYWAARDALAAVPGEFRSPLLPLLTGDVSARGLRRARCVYAFRTRPGPGVTMTEHRVGGRVPALVFAPTASAGRRPGILYLHGGGMIVGSPRSEAMGSGRLAREVDAVVVSPDYRLAPEHPFPAALDDCMATLHWMRDNADDLGIDPDRLAVTGSSAGGGLSAAVAQRAYDEGITLRAQVLVYPMIDDRTVLRDDHNGRGRFLWTPESNRFGWTAYLGRPPRPSDAPDYAAPARRENLSGLAPAWVGVGDLDLFFDESVDYAGRLRAAGVECELVTVAGMYHGADGLAAKHPSMKDFRRGVSDHLRRYLSPPN
ncbi:MAG: alpha/beta hydrolase [Mycobacterium sp.]